MGQRWKQKWKAQCWAFILLVYYNCYYFFFLIYIINNTIQLIDFPPPPHTHSCTHSCPLYRLLGFTQKQNNTDVEFVSFCFYLGYDTIVAQIRLLGVGNTVCTYIPPGARPAGGGVCVFLSGRLQANLSARSGRGRAQSPRPPLCLRRLPGTQHKHTTLPYYTNNVLTHKTNAQQCRTTPATHSHTTQTYNTPLLHTQRTYTQHKHTTLTYCTHNALTHNTQHYPTTRKTLHTHNTTLHTETKDTHTHTHTHTHTQTHYI